MTSQAKDVPYAATYRFPDGTTSSSGIEIFERILRTGESATATEDTDGFWHKGRVLTFDHVSALCRRNPQ